MENIVPTWPAIHREEPQVHFTSHEIDFELPDQETFIAWITDAIEEEGFEPGHIDYIFCSDEFLLEINKTHLGHDEYTDIITFSLHDNPLSGEIYISIERVKENAETFQTSFDNELSRVMIHGILHLCGYDDHSDDDIEEIRQKEEEYIGRLEV